MYIQIVFYMIPLYNQNNLLGVVFMAKVQYTLRIEESIFEKLKTVADIEKRSVNSQFEYFVEKALIEYEKQNGSILAGSEK